MVTESTRGTRVKKSRGVEDEETREGSISDKITSLIQEADALRDKNRSNIQEYAFYLSYW